MFLFLLAIISLLSVFTITGVLILVRKYRLLDVPVNRSSHKLAVPSFGGIAFFVNIILVMGAYGIYGFSKIGLIYLISVSVVFAIGFLDDINNWSFKIKVPLELFAIFLFLWGTGISITDFHGFFFINEVPVLVGTVMSAFIILFLMQAYNLIDGIDGFASVIGMVIFGSFSVLFWMLQDYFMLTLCITIFGSLFTFIWFNISKSRKIFMGDTGTLILGFTIGIATVKLLGLSATEITALPFQITALPYILLSILFIPVYDTLRVMLIRKLKGRPIFSADRNHLHHLITDYGWSHRRTSLVSGLNNILFIIITLVISIDFSTPFLVLNLIVGAVFLTLVLLNLDTSSSALRVKIWGFRKIQSVYNYTRRTALFHLFF